METIGSWHPGIGAKSNLRLRGENSVFGGLQAGFSWLGGGVLIIRILLFLLRCFLSFAGPLSVAGSCCAVVSGVNCADLFV